jgi:hypothetical protein
MNRKHNLLTIVLALSAGIAGHALYGSLYGSRGTAEVARTVSAAAARADLEWEFCAVTKAQYVGSVRGGAYWIIYFRGENVQTVPVETGPTGNAFARAISKLGDEGWDMVGEGPLEIRPGQTGGTPTAIFFKRRKEN